MAFLWQETKGNQLHQFGWDFTDFERVRIEIIGNSWELYIILSYQFNVCYYFNTRCKLNGISFQLIYKFPYHCLLSLFSDSFFTFPSYLHSSPFPSSLSFTSKYVIYALNIHSLYFYTGRNIVPYFVLARPFSAFRFHGNDVRTTRRQTDKYFPASRLLTSGI
jgi:hypothetical protein